MPRIESNPSEERATLAGLLGTRRPQIEQAALTRVNAISSSASVGDPAYVEGLRQAVVYGLTYGLTAVEATESRQPWPPPVPPQLLAQARFAARSGVALDTVLRRYFAGYTLLGDFIVRAAEEISAPASELQRVMRDGGASFDRLVAAVSDEYTREAEGRTHTAEERRAAQVRMLLDAEHVDVSRLGYEFDCWHLGLIATGPGAREALKRLAADVDRRLLAVAAGDGMAWAWLGGGSKLAAAEVARRAGSSRPEGEALAIGEPALGIDGWRLTHRQARAAQPFAGREDSGVVAYADVALLTSALQDEVLATSLRDAYLVPLEGERDGGLALRRTLRAFLAAGRNVSSAAAGLSVSRQTVKNRLAHAQELYGYPIEARAAEIETALRLHDLGLEDVPLRQRK